MFKNYQILILISVFVLCIIGACAEKKEYTIGIMQFDSRLTIDQTVEGIKQALEEDGFVDGKTCRIAYQNAQGDWATATSIAQKFVTDRVDLIVTVTTPCLQVAANVNKTIPHVFGCVTDPFRMGVAQDSVNHQPNVTGIFTRQPVEETITLVREVIPDLDNIGVVWNPAEACSEACVEMMRAGCGRHGIKLTEITVDATNQVKLAAEGLVARGVDLIFVSGDNTVEMALESVILVCQNGRIPVITNTPINVERGALLSLGANYTVVGYETGKLAARVARGEKPSDIPIRPLMPKKLWLNRKVAEELGISFPKSVLQEADRIVG